MIKFYLLTVFSILLTTGIGFAQKSKVSKPKKAFVEDTPKSMYLVMPGATLQMPYGDMAKRFGLSYSIGGSIMYKTKSNWLFGLDANFLNGNQVKEPNLMRNLATSEGGIIAQDGGLADLNVLERSWNLSFRFGKLFSISKRNRSSGIFISAGLGYLEHRIRIEVRGNNVQQLNGDYKKGYDRLTGGFAISQFIGYLHVSRNRFLNGYIGIELFQAFTKSYRGFNYDTGMPDTQNRLDGVAGLKFGWMLPIIPKKATDYYIR
jgi:hypothetical protein